jgi:hypothetical protein
MRVEREPRCPRCGSATYQRVSETESMCSECGLGRTSVPLQVELHAQSEPGATSPEDEPHALVDVRKRMHDAFADASFSPCGLDARWAGTRWFGGSGRADGVVTSLELAHGEDPWGEESMQVRVEVRLPRRVFEDDAANVEIERADLAREQVSRFWMTTGGGAGGV